MRFNRSAVAASLGAAVLLLASAPPATAVTFHQYSVAEETSYTNSYTGIAVTRTDMAMTGVANGCSGPIQGSPVYQTQWVLITSDAKNWIELGTGHQCNNSYRYWYWGYGYHNPTTGAVQWTLRGYQAGISVGASHTFYIKRSSGNSWAWIIDSTTKGTTLWQDQGALIQAGLESYDDTAQIASHTFGALRYTLNQGAWTYWAGFDGTIVNTPRMCGGWNDAKTWRASENRAC